LRPRRPRFSSPPVDWTEPALAAVLAWSFADAPDSGSRDEADAARAAELARRLGIGARLASRSVGGALGRWVQDELRAAVARDLAFEHALRAVAEEAGHIGAPIVLLKHAALRAGGWVRSGSRSATDLDLLVGEEAAAVLSDRLRARGFAVEGRAYEHQLAALRAPSGAVVELHTRVPGLRPPGVSAGRSLGLATLLEAAGARMRITESGARVPPADFLLAHAWFHTFVQHGAAPDLVPPTRFLADAQDLGLGTQGGGDLEERAAAWVEGGRWRAEFAAARRVVGALGEGRPSSLRPDPAAAALLDHALASAIDPRHALSVRRHWRRWALPQWSDRAWLPAVASYWSSELRRRERWAERVLPPVLFVGAFLRLTFWSRRVTIGELPAVLRRVGRAPGLASSASASRLAARLSPWVERFGAVVPPGDFGPCLKRSLLWLDLLSRCGIPARFHCGVRRGDRSLSAAGMEAHAWVTVEGRPFPGPAALPPGFVEVWVD
jgi:hypothetical protein